LRCVTKVWYKPSLLSLLIVPESPAKRYFQPITLLTLQPSIPTLPRLALYPSSECVHLDSRFLVGQHVDSTRHRLIFLWTALLYLCHPETTVVGFLEFGRASLHLVFVSRPWVKFCLSSHTVRDSLPYITDASMAHAITADYPMYR